MTDAAPTLRELIGHPLLAAATPLSGDDDLDRPVTGVTLIDPAETGLVRTGEIAVCPAVPAGYLSSWRLDAVIRRLRDQRAAALALPVPGPGGETVLDGSRRLARHLHLPILGIGTAPLRWAGAAVALVHSPAVDAADRLRRAHRALTRGLLSPQDVARALAAILERPVAVFGPDGTPIGASFEPPPGFDPHAMVAQILTVDGGTTVVVPVPGATSGTAGLWLAAALGPAPATWARGARDVLQAGTLAVQRWQATRRVVLERDARLRAGLFGDLLEGRLGGGDARQQRAAEIGWRLDGWHVAFHLAALGQVDLLGHSDAVAAAIAAERIDAIVVERGDGWSAWTTGRTEPDQDASRDLLAALQRVRHRLAGRFDCAIGVGRGYLDASGLTRSLAEAWDAARLARGRPQTGRLVHIDRLGLAQLLVAWASTETFAPTATRLLGPLESQPGELTATLSAYLDAGGSAADTAAILGVHRNTVAARLRRIEELLTVDLNNPDDRLALHLACRVTQDHHPGSA
ncbi:PucR family transcriptional regulator [Sphaerisporangium album]|uniref:PucR family transcriptional regulator n=1 Tax=Sphaerisporangium album TaxID=509200 RepID=A0A367FRB0_9ACTN|nr:helix-turn-helix domain-containing protein [Sphaerisporangium album]RCG32918.1 PucR family transcriptional regulator [Sphaerisporangium album]